MPIPQWNIRTSFNTLTRSLSHIHRERETERRKRGADAVSLTWRRFGLLRRWLGGLLRRDFRRFLHLKGNALLQRLIMEAGGILFHCVAWSEMPHAPILKTFLRARLKIIFLYLVFNFGAMTMGFVFLLRFLLCKTRIMNFECSVSRGKGRA